jgi:TrmH family RNA methyltransferase
LRRKKAPPDQQVKEAEMLEPANTTVILCNPEGEANIGGTARAMTCFGINHLVLVNPVNEPGVTAYNWACHGSEILDNLKQVNSLAEALQDVNLAFGFTRRCGKRRHKLLSLPSLKQELDVAPCPGRAALVFGNEKSGLSNEELEGCHRLVTIPSHGSLNLSHSVSLALYELFGRGLEVPGVYNKKLASAEKRHSLMLAVAKYLQAMGYPPQRGASPLEEIAKFTDILDRAQLEEWEIGYIGGMFKHLYTKFSECTSANSAKSQQ